MQGPVVVFDHIRKSVTVSQPGPTSDKQVQEALAAQRGQVTSAAGSPAR
jgi:hypothetical protein